MRRAIVLATAVAAMTGTAEAAAPVRGAAVCWDFDLAGTDAAERLEGTSGSEHAASFAGPDELLLFGGDDCAATGLGDDVAHLGPGDDEATTGPGFDRLYGGPGHDILLPGMGPDHVDGGEGDDLLRDERGDPSPDVLIGGEGDDVLRALNTGPDRVECGPGYDVAIVDTADTTTGCERVEVASRPRLASHVIRTGVRPVFALRWTVGDLALPARIEVRRVSSPGERTGCDVGAWRLSGTRLAWRGSRGACPGDYVFALTYVDARRGGPRVACERLDGAPRSGCTPSERLGVLTVAVR